MINKTISLPVEDCKRILLHSWDLLSPETQKNLTAIGISPKSQK